MKKKFVPDGALINCPGCGAHIRKFSVGYAATAFETVFVDERQVRHFSSGCEPGRLGVVTRRWVEHVCPPEPRIEPMYPHLPLPPGMVLKVPATPSERGKVEASADEDPRAAGKPGWQEEYRKGLLEALSSGKKGKARPGEVELELGLSWPLPESFWVRLRGVVKEAILSRGFAEGGIVQSPKGGFFGRSRTGESILPLLHSTKTPEDHDLEVIKALLAALEHCHRDQQSKLIALLQEVFDRLPAGLADEGDIAGEGKGEDQACEAPLGDEVSVTDDKSHADCQKREPYMPEREPPKRPANETIRGKKR